MKLFKDILQSVVYDQSLNDYELEQRKLYGIYQLWYFWEIDMLYNEKIEKNENGSLILFMVYAY